ncbi:immunity 8 family protein [Utexia brackfieldae]|uniref:immunity 8 family protein n=1 Tax=Utexia brackfieldae TaxID=3074108 RepID=UPI00370DAD96
MQAELKQIDSFDVDINNYCPDEDSFRILVTLFIGPKESNSINYFDLTICSTQYLDKQIYKPEILRHMLVVRKFNLDEIKNEINACIEKCNSNTWEETAQKLSRYFAWEFEDYQP